MAPTARSRARKTKNVSEQSLGDLVLIKLKKFSAWSSENRKTILKSLYGWLVYFKDDHMLSSKHLRALNSSLFEELQRMLLVKVDDAPVGRSLCQEKAKVDSHSSIEELLLLLRCSMVTLNGLGSDQELLLDKSQYLRQMLHTIFASSELIKKMFDREIDATSYLSNFFLEPCPPLLCSMLEVFVDELLVLTNLRKCVSDVCHPTRDDVLQCHATDFGCVVEAVFAHFLISVSMLHGFEDYFRSLAWMCKGNFPTPEISLTSAVTLFLNPAINYGPPLLLAHVMSVVSEVITASSLSENLDHNFTTLNCYLYSLERSVSIYHICMSSMEILSPSVDAGSLIVKQFAPVGNRPPSFWCQFKPTAHERIAMMLQYIDSSLGSSHCFSYSSGTKHNRVSTLTEYVKENLCVVEESCRDVAFSFLSSLISSVSGKAYESHRKENISMQELYVLASLLKLMSSSLLQAVRCLRNSFHVKHPKTSAGSHWSKERKFLVSIIRSFGAYKICMPIQQPLLDGLEAKIKNDGSKLMLVHLSGLLSFCLAEGLEVAKGCLSLTMVLLNLLFFEEGTLDFLNTLALDVLASCSTKSPSSSLISSGANGHDAGTESLRADLESLCEIQGVRSCSTQRNSIRKSSIKVASCFKQMHDLKLRGDGGLFSSLQERSEEEPTAEVPEPEGLHNARMGRRTRSQRYDWDKCDGFLSRSPTSLEVDDDIHDYLVCEPDLSYWLKARAKFRKWKSKKRAMQTRKKMQASRKGLKSRKKL